MNQTRLDRIRSGHAIDHIFAETSRPVSANFSTRSDSGLIRDTRRADAVVCVVAIGPPSPIIQAGPGSPCRRRRRRNCRRRRRRDVQPRDLKGKRAKQGHVPSKPRNSGGIQGQHGSQRGPDGGPERLEKEVSGVKKALKRIEGKADGKTAALKRVEDSIPTRGKERHNEDV